MPFLTFYDILIVGTCTIAQDVACIICTVATRALPWHGYMTKHGEPWPIYMITSDPSDALIS